MSKSSLVCNCCEYTWSKTDFDDGKGRIAYCYPYIGIEEGDFVCEECIEKIDKKEADLEKIEREATHCT